MKKQLMKTFIELLKELNACRQAIEWANGKTIEEVVKDCHRGDWLLWLAFKIQIDIKPLTLAKARCAKTVIHLMKDKRSIKAVEVAEKFGLGKCTIDEFNIAAADAADAAYAAYVALDNPFRAAADAASAVFSSSVTGYSVAAAAAAFAVGSDTFDSFDISSAADAAAAAASRDNQLKTADICRQILGELIINRVNILLNENN
jgi:hypothetical protein